MAMALDRVDRGVAERTDPARRHLTTTLRRRLRLASVGSDRRRGLLGRRGVAAFTRDVGADDCRTTAHDWLLAAVQSCSTTSRTPKSFLFQITSRSATTSCSTVLVPLQDFLVETPWPVTLLGITLISLVVSGRRAALTTFLMLGADRRDRGVGVAMDTPSQVLVATAAHGRDRLRPRRLGGGEPVFSKILRPVNDVLQTLPQLVYLIPLIYLMPVSIVPGVIAGVLYAFPVVARLVENGVRNVEANTVEAAASFGATRSQVLRKVKIPLARTP